MNIDQINDHIKLSLESTTGLIVKPVVKFKTSELTEIRFHLYTSTGFYLGNTNTVLYPDQPHKFFGYTSGVCTSMDFSKLLKTLSDCFDKLYNN